MKDIVQVCNKTIAESICKYNETETFLKSNSKSKQEQVRAIKTEIQSNKTAVKKNSIQKN